MNNYPTLTLTIILFGLLLSSCGGTAGEVKYSSGDTQTRATQLAKQVTDSTTLPKASNSPLPAATTPSLSAASPTLSTAETESSPDLSSMKQRKMVEKARADLGEYLNLTAEQIHVVEIQATSWPDTSLGCPRPDMKYATVVTPGFWILLEANEIKYPYHTDQSDSVLLCLGDSDDLESGTAPRPVFPVDPGQIQDGIPWVPVD